MIDEAHFNLGGYVNKLNYRIWGSENPKMIIEKLLYPQRVTVWCGFWTHGKNSIAVRPIPVYSVSTHAV